LRRLAFGSFVARIRCLEQGQVGPGLERAGIPKRRSPVETHRAEGVGRGEPLDRMDGNMPARS
jgi:hypothetical protein